MERKQYQTCIILLNNKFLFAFKIFVSWPISQRQMSRSNPHWFQLQRTVYNNYIATDPINLLVLIKYFPTSLFSCQYISNKSMESCSWGNAPCSVWLITRITKTSVSLMFITIMSYPLSNESQHSWVFSILVIHWLNIIYNRLAERQGELFSFPKRKSHQKRVKIWVKVWLFQVLTFPFHQPIKWVTWYLCPHNFCFNNHLFIWILDIPELW